MLKLSKKIALPLIAVLIIGTIVGGYFLFRNFQIPSYFVDKYPELLEYCDTEENGNTLTVSCKALILEILPNEESPSLVFLIITKDEELREYTITEKEDMFAFTNDVLQFKKLKPVIVNLQYVKKNPITYSMQGIRFENIPETYIQDLVNRDIEEIMNIDKSSTTILNSFDFCPRPETLPEYVNSQVEYKVYFDKNIQSTNSYKIGPRYGKDLTTIYSFLFCESARNLGYNDICKTIPNKNSLSIPQNLSRVSMYSQNLIHKEILENKDITLLNLTSMLYDNLYLYKQNYAFLYEDFESFLRELNTIGEYNDILYSTSKKLFYSTEILSYLIEESSYPKEYSSLLFTNDLQKHTHTLDINGLYIYHYFTNKKIDVRFRLLEKCNNISVYVKNV